MPSFDDDDMSHVRMMTTVIATAERVLRYNGFGDMANGVRRLSVDLVDWNYIDTLPDGKLEPPDETR